MSPRPHEGERPADAPAITLPSQPSKIKLHIGGKQVKDGWKIMNAIAAPGVDYVGDIRDLSQFKEGACEAVYGSHIIEHINQRDMLGVLRQIHRVLTPGGSFYCAVPDLDVLSRMFLDPQYNFEQRFHVMRMMFGGQIDDYDFHYIGLNHEILKAYLQQAGFSHVERVNEFDLFEDTSSYKPYGVPISLNVIARKE